MNNEANYHPKYKSLHKVVRIVDGDGIIVSNIFNNGLQEIRLLGIDAPEIKNCRKLKKDERETHTAGQFLIEMGWLSLKYLINLVKINEVVTIETENIYSNDVYGRTLAYVYLSDGTCINQKLIEEGFAKPMSQYYCRELTKYQVLNMNAKNEKKGLYAIVDSF